MLSIYRKYGKKSIVKERILQRQVQGFCFGTIQRFILLWVRFVFKPFEQDRVNSSAGLFTHRFHDFFYSNSPLERKNIAPVLDGPTLSRSMHGKAAVLLL